MQAGFALLEAGSVRDITVANIMMKNIFDAVLGFVAFWAVGRVSVWFTRTSLNETHDSKMGVLIRAL